MLRGSGPRLAPWGIKLNVQAPRTSQRCTGSYDHGPWYPFPGMHEDEHGYMIVPHEVATGADCGGCLMVVAHGGVADLVCNSCGAVVDTVPIDRAGSRLMELASAEMCSALCPHCGAINVFPGFTVIEAFVCQECAEGVRVERAGAVNGLDS
jgi:hypothetical protein